MDFKFDMVIVSALIVGTTQTIKELFNLEGKQVRIVTVLLGFFLYGLSFAMDQLLIPEAAHIWIKLVVYSFIGAASAMGYYDIQKKPQHDEKITINTAFPLTDKGREAASD